MAINFAAAPCAVLSAASALALERTEKIEPAAPDQGAEPLQHLRSCRGNRKGSRQKTLEVALREPGSRAAEHLGVPAGAKVVEVLRVRFFDGTPAMIERTSFVPEVGRPLFDFDTDASIFAFLTADGVDLHGARQTIDAVAATNEDAELLNQAPGTPLVRERRLTSSADGQPSAKCRPRNQGRAHHRILPRRRGATAGGAGPDRSGRRRAASSVVSAPPGAARPAAPSCSMPSSAPMT